MQISNEKREKILEQILALLYLSFPKPLFTKHIAIEIIRDEEFTKKLLFELKKRNLVLEIKKNPKGKEYIRRSRWKISDNTYRIYKNKQH
jgi:hypothetical protein